MRNLRLVRKHAVRSLNGLKFGISAKGRTARLLSHGSLSPEQFEAARRVGSYDCVSTESGEFHLVQAEIFQQSEPTESK